MKQGGCRSLAPPKESLLRARKRWLRAVPPARGVDVGATVEIHQFINGLADEGLAVVVISSYLPEVLAPSDRILVAKRGKIVEEIKVSGATEQKIMYAAVH